MLIPIAMGLSAGAVTCLLLAWTGERWNRTKSDSWILTKSSTEGHTGPALTGAKIYRDIIRHPRGHKLWGIAFTVLAAVAWVSVILQLSS
jgi:hypothetical protein